MLLVEEPLDSLVDRLRSLPARDRRAVLAHLSAVERRRLQAALRLTPSSREVPDYAADIVARIVAPDDDSAMTASGRAALARAAGRTGFVSTRAASRSLVGHVAGWLSGR